jgi:phosphoribosyl-dephospho-CoA transferase
VGKKMIERQEIQQQWLRTTMVAIIIVAIVVGGELKSVRRVCRRFL